MYRKFIICLALACTTAAVYAQNAYDALRYSQQYTEGTARSMAMGNAVTALGGDIGGITINPASSAVYRYSEVVVTPSVTTGSSNASYLGYSQQASKTRAGISNIGYVNSFNTGREDAGLVSWSFGFAITKQNNFTNARGVYGRTNSSSWLSSLAYNTDGIYAPDMDLNDKRNPYFMSNASWNSILAWNNSLLDTLPGTNNQYIAATENLNGYDISVGGDLDQKFKSISIGNITEATINFGGNFSNKLYAGINIGIQSLSYKYEERYSEAAVNSSSFNSGFSNFSAAYRYRAAGTGINIKAGLIYVPVEWLRFGASISTPTWTYINEEWENSMNSSFNDGYAQSLVSPLGTYSYKLNTPFRWNAGAAVRLGMLGVISADFEQTNYSQCKLVDTGYDLAFSAENEQIKSELAVQNIVRIGAEFNLSPAFALRGGYQYYSSPYSDKSADDSIHTGSLGIGYATKCGFFADLTYQQLLKKPTENFSLYNDTMILAPTGTAKNNNWKILLSLGLRF